MSHYSESVSAGGPKNLDGFLASKDPSIPSRILSSEDIGRHLQANYLSYMSVVSILLVVLGLSALELRTVSPKSWRNVLSKNLSGALIAGICWLAIGHDLVWGHDAAGQKRIYGFAAISGETSPESVFHLACASVLPILVGFTLTGRVDWTGFLIMTLFVSLLVYPIAAHMVYAENGLLKAVFGRYLGAESAPVAGVGSMAVLNAVAGFTAIHACIMCGPRRIFPPSIPPAWLVPVGTLSLWFGLIGITSTSIFILPTPQEQAAAVKNGAVSLGIATLAVGVADFMLGVCLRGGTFDLVQLCNGLRAALVGATAGAARIEPFAAALIGFTCAIVAHGTKFLVESSGVDDPGLTFSIHGICGIWGLLLIAFCDADHGIIGVSPDGNFLSQLFVSLSLVVWVSVTTLPLFYVLRRAGLLRAASGEEYAGLEETQDGANGGNVTATSRRIEMSCLEGGLSKSDIHRLESMRLSESKNSRSNLIDLKHQSASGLSNLTEATSARSSDRFGASSATADGSYSIGGASLYSVGSRGSLYNRNAIVCTTPGLVEKPFRGSLSRAIHERKNNNSEPTPSSSSSCEENDVLGSSDNISVAVTRPSGPKEAPDVEFAKMPSPKQGAFGRIVGYFSKSGTSAEQIERKPSKKIEIPAAKATEHRICHLVEPSAESNEEDNDVNETPPITPNTQKRLWPNEPLQRQNSSAGSSSGDSSRREMPKLPRLDMQVVYRTKEMHEAQRRQFALEKSKFHSQAKALERQAANKRAAEKIDAQHTQQVAPLPEKKRLWPMLTVQTNW